MKNKKLTWSIVHESDDENGNPTMWVAKINHPKFGPYCWISDMSHDSVSEFHVETLQETLKQCKSLASAKRWVAQNLI